MIAERNGHHAAVLPLPAPGMEQLLPILQRAFVAWVEQTLANGLTRPAGAPAERVETPEAEESPAVLPAKLRRVHRAILAKATDKPMPVKVLVDRAGYSPNTYSRDAVTDLVRWRLLVRLPEGIVLAGGKAVPRAD